jgi:hypothetical protein
MGTDLGIKTNWTDAEYRKFGADLEPLARFWNYSTLKYHEDSAANVKAVIDGGTKQTPAMFIGELAHCRVLEPGEFSKRYVQWPGARHGKEYDKALEDATANGKKFYIQSEFEQAAGLSDAVRANDAAAAILDSPTCEKVVVVLWRDEVTGLYLKGKLDFVDWSYRIAGDFKTTTDASPAGFGKEIANRSYCGQAGMYLAGLRAVSPPSRIDWEWVWIAAEKKKPAEVTPQHMVGVYTSGPHTLEIGAKLYRKWLDAHLVCVKSGEWPGYATGDARLPYWYTQQFDVGE